MKKRIISVLLVFLLAFTGSIGVSAANGSQNDMYSLFQKNTIKYRRYSNMELSTISLYAEDVITGQEAIDMAKEGNRFNKLPDEETNLFIFKMNVSYISGPDKQIDTRNFNNPSYVTFYDGDLNEVQIHAKAILDKLKYPQSIKLDVGENAIFYIPILINKSVGYPYYMLKNSQTNDTWYNMDPDFKQSAVKNIAVKSVKMNATEVTLNKGANIQLQTIVSPANASNKSVKWTTSKSSVASVNNKGVVTAKKKGTTIITATTADGKKIAKCVIKVK